MNINNLIKEAHQTAIDKGWYDCDECEGTGVSPNELGTECLVCNGTGKNIKLKDK